MLNVDSSKLKLQAEKIIAEAQTEFKARMSTSEQAFNLRILYKISLHFSQTIAQICDSLKRSFSLCNDLCSGTSLATQENASGFEKNTRLYTQEKQK